MLVLNPAENFPIVRVLQDHTDATTNYVQAVIRDATTDSVLATVNLDDKGNRRFQKLWKVPWDNTFANGRYILITTSVYTDNLYTTKNANYAEVGDTYLVQQRWSQGTYTAAGAGVDYKEVRKIIKEELAAIPHDEPEPYPQPIDPTPQLKELVDGIATVGKKVDAIEMPKLAKPQPVDFAPIERALTTIIRAIEAQPKFEKIDYAPAIADLATEIRSFKEHLYLSSQTSALQKMASDMIAELEKSKPYALTISNPDDKARSVKEDNLKKLKAKYGI